MKVDLDKATCYVCGTKLKNKNFVVKTDSEGNELDECESCFRSYLAGLFDEAKEKAERKYNLEMHSFRIHIGH